MELRESLDIARRRVDLDGTKVPTEKASVNISQADLDILERTSQSQSVSLAKDP